MSLLQKYPSILNWIEPKFSIELLTNFKQNYSDSLIKNVFINHPKQLKKVDQLLTSIDRKLGCGFKILCPLDDNYPYSLNFHFFCPTPLMYKGEFYKDKKILSVVGSRNLSPTTKEWMSSVFKDYLVKHQDLVIASGGAYGVDQLAHKLSLTTQTPTYCVVPAGLNNIYPKNLTPILNQIIEEKGVVLSPFPPDFPIFKSNFYYRNRVLVLLSDFVFVAEARRRSGSMMTASLAAEFGVKTFTLPQVPLPQVMGNLDLMHSGVAYVKNNVDLEQILNG